MPLPSKESIHLPLLKVINDAGGTLSTREAIQQVKNFFPALTDEDKASRLDSGANRLNNRIMWARADLAESGEIGGGNRGEWQITEKGKQRLARDWATWKPEYASQSRTSQRRRSEAQALLAPTGPRETVATGKLLDPHEELEAARRRLVEKVEADVLERLRSVDPSDFESIIAQLLEKLGYGSIADGTIQVTGRSGDGGIDGECAMDALGLYKVKFQAKRWANQVSSKEVRDFVGALTTERVEQGIFATTSTFSQDAIQTAKKAGKVKLIDGKELSRIMVEAGLGVRKASLWLPKLDEDYFSGLV